MPFLVSEAPRVVKLAWCFVLPTLTTYWYSVSSLSPSNVMMQVLSDSAVVWTFLVSSPNVAPTSDRMQVTSVGLAVRTQILALCSETAPSIGPCEILGVSLAETVWKRQRIASANADKSEVRHNDMIDIMDIIVLFEGFRKMRYAESFEGWGLS